MFRQPLLQVSSATSSQTRTSFQPCSLSLFQASLFPTRPHCPSHTLQYCLLQRAAEGKDILQLDVILPTRINKENHEQAAWQF